MKQTEVLIIGCGIAGCTTAYTLAKRGVQVTISAPWSEPLKAYSYGAEEGIAYEADNDSTDARSKDWNAVGQGLGSPRALEVLASQGPRVVEELLLDDLGLEFDRNETGEWLFQADGDGGLPRSLTCKDATAGCIFEALWKRLEEMPNVEILEQHYAIELLTLGQHSRRAVDIYKKPACLGAYLLDAKSGEVKTILAKETVLAVAGIAGLFQHSALPSWISGQSLSLAHMAGARVLHTDVMTFHPLSLYLTNGATLPLPDTLRRRGGEILSPQKERFLHTYFERGSQASKADVAAACYREVQRGRMEHLWLDLKDVDKEWIRNSCPRAIEQCAARGVDLENDLIPIVPSAHLSCGGVAVDRTGQTTVQRLRAVGQGTCTGVHGAHTLPSVALLETLVWGQACGEDIAKQVNRFAYTFPEVRGWTGDDAQADPVLVDQDWRVLRHTMWTYAGPLRNKDTLYRARSILQPLWQGVERKKYGCRLSPELLGLIHGLRAAMCMVHESLWRETNRASQCEFLRQPTAECELVSV